MLAGLEEYEHQEKVSLENVMIYLENYCPTYIHNITKESEKLRITPTEYAYIAAEKVLYNLVVI